MNPFLKLFMDRKMVLIMSLPANDPDLARQAFARGADAVKVHINLTHRASGNSFGSFEENRAAFEWMLSEARGPMGLVLGGLAKDAAKDARAVAGSGFSFVSLYGHHAPTEALRLPQALMAACDSTYAMDEVAAFEAAGASVVEASVVPGGGYGQLLNFRDLLTYRRIARATGLPVVVPTQRVVRPADVALLHRAGVRGIMIGAIVTGTERETIGEAVAAFRAAIDEL